MMDKVSITKKGRIYAVTIARNGYVLGRYDNMAAAAYAARIARNFDGTAEQLRGIYQELDGGQKIRPLDQLIHLEYIRRNMPEYYQEYEGMTQAECLDCLMWQCGGTCQYYQG